MAAEYDDLPDMVKKEVQRFADVNISWLAKVLIAAGVVKPEESAGRARAIYAAISGAQLMARGRSDIAAYDSLVEDYRKAGLLPS
jgi:TetR/AcrR family transcriptional repressor of nem operon